MALPPRLHQAGGSTYLTGWSAELNHSQSAHSSEARGKHTTNISCRHHRHHRHHCLTDPAKLKPKRGFWKINNNKKKLKKKKLVLSLLSPC